MPGLRPGDSEEVGFPMRCTTMAMMATMAILGAAIATSMLVPADRLAYLLRDGAAAAAASGASGAPSEFEVVVRLQYNGSATWEHRSPVGRLEAARVETDSGGAQQEYVTRAKTALAESQGYHAAVYGPDAHKILSGVQVLSVRVRDVASGQIREIYRNARRDADPAVTAVLD
jgi:hypothetical protein